MLPAAASRFTSAFLPVGYLALYLVWLWFSLESELWHWLTLVLLPLVITALFAAPGMRKPSLILSRFGLERRLILRGYGLAIFIGLALCAVQFFISNNAEQLRQLFSTSEGYLLLLPALGLMVVTAGFTEEFFFRGWLQTRLAAILRPWLAVVLASVLFALYHVPYAYLKPSWPSYGDIAAAFALAFGQSLPIGLLLGWVYLRSGNLLSAVALHALIDTLPAVIWLHDRLGA